MESKKFMGSKPAIGKARAAHWQQAREAADVVKYLARAMAIREGLTTLEDGREMGDEELEEALDRIQAYVFRVSRETSG